MQTPGMAVCLGSSAPDVLARAAAASGSTAESLLRASAASGATMVTWPTLRCRATSALPYQCTLAPGTCQNRQLMTQHGSRHVSKPIRGGH